MKNHCKLNPCCGNPLNCIADQIGLTSEKAPGPGYFKSSGNTVLDAGLAQMLPQLLICWANREKGTLRVPAAEIDGTGGYILSMEIDPVNKVFTFTTQKKN